MRYAWWSLLFGLGVLISGSASCESKTKETSQKEEPKGTVVNLGGLQSRTPSNWKEEKPSSKMRVFQFLIPKARADKENAELVIFYFGPESGGSAEENVKRWKGMFLPPPGKSIDEVAKVEKKKVSEAPVTYLDVEGTYLYKAQPFNPNAPTEKKPGYRMLAVVVETKKGSYFIRLVGPAATVADNKKGFDHWLNSFK